MISIEQVTKKFGGIRALDQVEAQISENSIFGLAGTNRSRKKYAAACDQRCAAAGGRAGED